MSDSTSTFVEQWSVVLFADLCDSTRLYATLGDVAALNAVNNCLGLIRAVAEEYRGHIVKTLGDGLMAVFPDAAAATQAACEMQTRVSALPPVGKNRLALRVGCSDGPVLADAHGRDIYGDTVNVAARMREFARPGQIIATESTVLELPPLQRVATRRLESIHVKGKLEAIPVVELLWNETDDATLFASRSFGLRASPVKLRLSYGGKLQTVEGDGSILTVGRDATSNLLVDVPTASRRHARIECRSDHFVYVDESTNGSFVTVQGEPEFRLMHEDWIMRGKGWISLGQRRQTAPGLALAFDCQEAG